MKNNDNFTARVYKDEKTLQKLQKIKQMYSDLKTLLVQCRDSFQHMKNEPVNLSLYTDENAPHISQKQIDLIILQKCDYALQKWKDIVITENKQQTFVQNKGCKLEISLVDSKGNLYQDNIIMYVLIHEMSHMLNPLYGHGPLFWKINKRLLYLSMVKGIYKYQDYRTTPFVYGKVNIQYNILEDDCSKGLCSDESLQQVKADMVKQMKQMN